MNKLNLDHVLDQLIIEVRIKSNPYLVRNLIKILEGVYNDERIIGYDRLFKIYHVLKLLKEPFSEDEFLEGNLNFVHEIYVEVTSIIERNLHKN